MLKQINRAQVLTLWGAVVAECLGHPRDTALKLPRFGGVFDGYIYYVSVVTTSIRASYAIGER
jgi:hypothetical protein